VKEGDLVDVPDVWPEPILMPKPNYPPLAARQRQGGTVILSVLVDENGVVRDVKVLRGIKPDLGLDAAAVAAVRNWRYKPATKDGVKVKTWFTQPIPFKPQ
jgi:TonB family protein